MQTTPGLVLALAVSLVAVPCADASAQAATSRNILTLHLGSPAFPANPILDAGIREAFAERPDVPIAYYAEYLEDDLFSADEAAVALAGYIHRKYSGRRIDLVIANTDTMLRFALANRARLFPEAPIVYFGLDPIDDRTRSAGAGVTGITVAIAYAETLKLALALHPSTRRVFVIANSGNGRTVESVQSEFSRFPRPVNFTYLTQTRVADLLSSVRAVPPDSIVVYVWHSQAQPAHVIYADAIARLVAEAAPVPVYGTSDLYLGAGVVGGVVRNTRDTGRQLGALAVRILTGTSARDIPIRTARVAPMLDWRQVRRWDIDASRLPPESAILFRQPSAWERYKRYIVGIVTALVAQAALIAALLIQRARRRQADAALHRSYARVRHLGSRLLSAQESERSRIARELHDDIGQQVAVLKLELTMLLRGVQADSEASVADATRRADRIASGIRDLSHRLDPARLRLLGLVPALAGLQGDLARSGVTIGFSHANVPADLPADLTVSLFRIVQEGLQNAIKYSRARTIALDVRRAGDELVVSVADDGVGFDTGAVSGAGLGLTSVRERADVFGGTVEVRSSPGEGTTLEVRVPIGRALDGRRGISAVSSPRRRSA